MYKSKVDKKNFETRRAVFSREKKHIPNSYFKSLFKSLNLKLTSILTFKTRLKCLFLARLACVLLVIFLVYFTIYEANKRTKIPVNDQWSADLEAKEPTILNLHKLQITFAQWMGDRKSIFWTPHHVFRCAEQFEFTSYGPVYSIHQIREC